ncbi:hypothetical protein GCM10007874_50540 [Labrys miyagiensis]|uniref:Uncharacterized protein n=1 Tax=Labrys miyagiensis TaxID=346912 RepID=A0ABQ6CNS7_9HYPH|nr:hypothetical protein GCM10007874_50540 [Labrys miyagiensis]
MSALNFYSDASRRHNKLAYGESAGSLSYHGGTPDSEKQKARQ